MLESIHISGFRRYTDFEIENFNEINFLLGANNSGKTSVLEAIYTWACGQNVAPMMNIPLARARFGGFQHAYWVMEEILAMFNNRHNLPLLMSFEGRYCGKIERFDHTIYPSDLLTEYDSSYKNEVGKTIPHISSAINEQINAVGLPSFNPVLLGNWEVINEKKKITAQITSPFSTVNTVNPYVSAKFIDILSHTTIRENVQMYASLKREGLIEEVVERINSIFPEVVNFDMIPYPDGSQAPVSVVKKDGQVLPLYAFGDGLQRWFYIIGALTINKNAIICIDEIDAGFHPSAQIEFCRNVLEYALKNNVQLFITTHNIEFIDRFIETIIGDVTTSKKVNIFTMRDFGDSDIRVRSLSAKSAYEARDSFNMELR